MSAGPRIVLVHAVAVAVEPVAAAFAARWPEAEMVNLLEDSLSRDRAAEGELSAHMYRRFAALTRYALDIGARGILFTCSAFGDAIRAAAETVPVPVLKPNEAMFEAALGMGRRIGMLATFEPSVASMEEEFREAAGSAASIETVCVPEAMAALRDGDAATHNRLLAEAAARLGHCDAVMLAHFSTSRAYDAVSSVLARPVLTSPGAAVDKLRREIG
ncbi:MAG: aspartate/glutamate racemase family protein [Gammaproteobacteria bacterium]|nr:aspartate/glutamate racemase family protein [Gammaproteobacteria bacterium]